MKTIETRLAKISELSRIIPINIDIAIKAAEYDFKLRKKAKEKGLREPGLFDAIILATAKVHEAKLITGDIHFKEFSEVIWIGE